MSRSNREKLIASFKGVASAQNRSKLDVDPVGAFFQQKAMSEAQIRKVYGSPEEFLESYASFERTYYQRLETHLDATKANRIMAEFNKKRNIIDLSILNREAQQELTRLFKTNVMKVSSLVQQAGLPGIELPSGNLYRSAFQFRVDNSQGVLHPAQILLNRNIFNFNSDRMLEDSISLNRHNMFSSKGLRQLYDQMKPGQSGKPMFDMFEGLKEGARIVTLDTETTGIAEKSQVRSISAVNMMFRNGKYELEEKAFANLGFRSPELNGITAHLGGSNISLNSLLSKLEGTQFQDMGPGGKTFLDESSKFIENILGADRLVGHNVQFDLRMLTQSMMAQPGFNFHDNAGKMIGALYDKIDQGDYLVDTLESTRMYMRNKAEQALATIGDAPIDTMNAKYIKSILAESTLAKINIGGSAGYADVGNVAMNTNLFELIEQEKGAGSFFDLLTKGSHVAETDVHLQSYIAKYIQEGTLDLRTDANRASKSAFGNYARNIIAKSHALTPTTDIADIAHLSETVLAHVKGAGITDVVARGLGAEFGVMDPALSKAEGMVQFLKSKNGFVFSSAEGTADLDTDSVKGILSSMIDQARATELAGGDTVSMRVGGMSRNISTNVANSRILNYGVSYGAASSIDQLAAFGSLTPGVATADSLLSTIGTVYSQLGSGLSPGDQVRAARDKRPLNSVFQHGLADFDHAGARKIAQAYASIGDAYAGVMTMGDKALSAGIAEATAPLAREAMRELRKTGGDPMKHAYALNSKVTSELGFSYFRKQREMRVFAATEKGLASSRPLVPLEIIKDIMGDKFPTSPLQVGLSQAFTGGDQSAMRFNLVWKAGQQIQEQEARTLAEGLFDMHKHTARIAKVMGMKEHDLVGDQKFMGQVQQANTVVGAERASQIEELTQKIMANGIGIGYADGREGQGIAQATMNARLMNLTDQDMPQTMTVAGEVGDTIATSPLVDREAVVAAGRGAELIAAETIRPDGISEGLHRVGEIGKILESDKALASRLRLNMAGAKVGLNPNTLVDAYKKFKPRIGLGVGIGLAAGVGYYMHKRNEKNALFDETIEAQPTEPNRNYAAVSSYNSSKNTFAGDPLSTAGIVGNLDRMKIGHTQMGNNKYNHLYGG